MPQLTLDRSEWPARIELSVKADMTSNEERALLEVTVRATDGTMLAWSGGTLRGLELEHTDDWAVAVLQAYRHADTGAVVRAHRRALREARKRIEELHETVAFLRK